ncbi:MAG: GIY-YIG nuclease family protein [Nanoarchaeota archaeon]|nr:GIY-YIG nuclease family protein [Nanoarchaeota archaeon]
MKGVYILGIKVARNISVRIGSLGKIKFEKGNYVYVGSAQNSLEKRIARHLSKTKKLRWHIDYLLSNKNAKVVRVFYRVAPKSVEDKTACKILEFGTPIKKFGSSDSKCISHLFKVEDFDFVYEMEFKDLLKR